jgi:hypothetical protein
MPHRPQPLGRIFQPEIAGEAIYWAARHRRRELWVGFPAVQAILGTRVVPGYLDRSLAREAYSGQQDATSVGADRRDNLFEPVPGDHGVHGRFDDEAVSKSRQLWLDTHRWVLGIAAIPLALLALSRFARSIKTT